MLFSNRRRVRLTKPLSWFQCTCTQREHLESSNRSIICCVKCPKLHIFVYFDNVSVYSIGKFILNKTNEEKSNRIRLLGKFRPFQMEEFIYNFSICVCNFICHSKLFWLDAIPKITLLNVNWVLNQRFSYSQCVVFLLITDSAIRTVIKIIMNNFRMFALFISISWLKERNKSKYSSASLYSIRKWDQLAHGIWTFKLNYYTMTTKTNHIRSRRLLFFIEH